MVDPLCWPVVRVFAAAATQWRIAPSGRLAGLDYPGAEAAARGLGIRWRAVFAGLRVMEREALAVSRERG